MQLLREPFFHFVLLGVAIFAWFQYLNPSETAADDSGSVIVIDAADVQRMIEQFKAVWQRPPTPDELRALVDGLVREEVLVREARALALDRDDAVIRSRLAQKMDFLTTSAAQSMLPEDEILIRHLQENAERFTSPGGLSFDQIALAENTSPEQIAAIKTELAQGTDPETLGKPSLLPYTIPMSSPAQIDRLFGSRFHDAVAAQPDGAWSGPVASGYGPHLVRVSGRKAAELPAFDTIRDDVLADWRREASEDLAKAQMDGLKERYELVLPDLAQIETGQAQ